MPEPTTIFDATLNALGALVGHRHGKAANHTADTPKREQGPFLRLYDEPLESGCGDEDTVVDWTEEFEIENQLAAMAEQRGAR